MKAKTISAKEFRKDIFRALDDVADNLSPYILTKNGEPKAIVMSLDEMENLMETYEVLADPELMKQIKSYQKKPKDLLDWDDVKSKL